MKNQTIKEWEEGIRNILVKVEWHSLPIDFGKNRIIEIVKELLLSQRKAIIEEAIKSGKCLPSLKEVLTKKDK